MWNRSDDVVQRFPLRTDLRARVPRHSPRFPDLVAREPPRDLTNSVRHKSCRPGPRSAPLDFGLIRRMEADIARSPRPQVSVTAQNFVGLADFLEQDTDAPDRTRAGA